jgi:Domain of unknown function (DUF6379)
MFSRHLVESAALNGRRLELSVRLNWYRSLPLSCVERLEVRLDDAPVDVLLELDGGRWPVADLGRQNERWWHVRDSARLSAELAGEPGDGPHTVEVLIGTRIPYLVGPDDHAVVIVDRARAELSR